MNFRLSLSLALACFGILLVGCSKNVTLDAMESDVNGYACRKCAEKFYTDQKVYAENCPKCQSMDITEAIGFVCKHDNHVTVAPRGADRAPCGKCGKPVNEIKLPREPELKAWGAVKHDASTVIGKGRQ